MSTPKKPKKTYAYVRISTTKQKLHRQLDYFQELGIKRENIYVDTVSGKNFERPAYRKLFRKLQEGDTLYVKELDRFGRNKQEIKEELKRLRDKKIRVKITNIPTTMHDFGDDDWILDMVNNILIEVLAAVAEQERITNHKRQAEGIKAAKSRGVHMGRPSITLPENFPYYYECWKNKTLTNAEILEALQVDYVKFSTYVRSYRNHQDK